MKKSVSLLLAFLLSISAAQAIAGDKPLRVLTSFLPVYLFTKNVVGSAPGLGRGPRCPVRLGAGMHYALVPSDMKKIAAADLFVVNGKGMEEFLGRRSGRSTRKSSWWTRRRASRRSGNEDKDEHGELNPHTRG